MQISTGDVFELRDPHIATIPPDDLIELHGTRDQVDDHVRASLGAIADPKLLAVHAIVGVEKEPVSDFGHVLGKRHSRWVDVLDKVRNVAGKCGG